MKRFFAAVLLSLAGVAQAAISFQPGDRVVFVGNTFAERLGQHGYLEAILSARLPELKLTFRNLGWSADTVAGPNLRPLNFGDQAQHLSEQKPTVIFACYGMSESFAGQPGLEQFQKDLTAWVQQIKSADFSGKGGPRIVLVSPIAHEQLGGRLPDPTTHNTHLALYKETMRAVAKDTGCDFIDLFNPTQKLMRDSATAGASPLTFNGIHLTEYGYWAVSQMMADALGVSSDPWTIQADAANISELRAASKSLPIPAPPKGVKIHKALRDNLSTVTVKGLEKGTYELRAGDQAIASGTEIEWAAGVPVLGGSGQEQASKLLATVDDKNQQFFHRWHAVNGEYIYGRRKEPFGVVNFPAEMKQLDEMVAESDAKIWQLSQPAGTETFRLVKVTKP